MDPDELRNLYLSCSRLKTEIDEIFLYSQIVTGAATVRLGLLNLPLFSYRASYIASDRSFLRPS